ncbi:MAG: ATPase, T2SS/T4P/T4SS family, partial [Planctomycetota bacterium]
MSPQGNGEDLREIFRRQGAGGGLYRAAQAPARAPAQWKESVDEPADLATSTDYVSVKAELQERVIDEMQRQNLLGEGDDVLSAAVEDFVQSVLDAEDLPVTESERAHLAQELVEETLGVGPLAPLMSDPAITDILVNGYDQVFIERFGRLEETKIRFRDNNHVRRIIERLAMRVGRRIDQSSPMVDLRLSDGSRVNATIPPATIDGPTLSIRRFGRNRLRSSDLMRLGAYSNDMAA